MHYLVRAGCAALCPLLPTPSLRVPCSNHRPLFDVSTDDIAAAFAALGKAVPKGRLTREALVSALLQLGESMQRDEVQEALQVCGSTPCPHQ